MNKTDVDGTLRIVLIVGSVRRPRMADPLVDWLRAALAAVDWIELDTIDLAEYPLPAAELSLGGSATSPVASRLADADGFLLLTPEYNHSFPSAVKNAIDWHLSEWAYKPVAFVAYGAGSGGVRAVEHLRPVFAELRATTTRDAVLLASPWERLDEAGRFVPDDGILEALAATLEELRWWATALRDRRVMGRVGAS